MLRRSHTAVLEKNETYSADFETEPYEVGWASEARFFVQVLEIDSSGGGGRAELEGAVQISADGLRWCDEGTVLGPVNESGLYSVKVSEFGSWLRLRCQVSEGSAFKLMVYLALKE